MSDNRISGGWADPTKDGLDEVTLRSALRATGAGGGSSSPNATVNVSDYARQSSYGQPDVGYRVPARPSFELKWHPLASEVLTNKNGGRAQVHMVRVNGTAIGLALDTVQNFVNAADLNVKLIPPAKQLYLSGITTCAQAALGLGASATEIRHAVFAALGLDDD